MTKLPQNVITLLGKLYNLKSDEKNVIIDAIKEDIEKTQKEIDEVNQSIKEVQISQGAAQTQLETFNTEAATFKEIFGGLDNQAFASLEAVGVNLRIGDLLSILDNKSSDYCEELKKQITQTGAEISDKEIKVNGLEAQLYALEDKLELSKNNSRKLASLLDQCLSKNGDLLTPKQVREILTNFDTFSQSEISILAKLILFPEDGLIDFVENYDTNNIDFSQSDPASTEETELENNEAIEDYQNTNRVDESIDTNSEEVNISDEIEVIPNDSKEDQDLVEKAANDENDTKDENNDIESTQVFSIDELNHLNNGYSETPATDDSPEIEPENSDIANLKEQLSSLGLNLSKFIDNNKGYTEKEIYSLLGNVDLKVVEENFEILRSLNVQEDAIYRIRHKHSYLTDLDLNKKITLLRAKGISESSIMSLINSANSGLNENYETFESRVLAIENTDEKLTDDNLFLLSVDIAQYEANLKKLEDCGYELDEKEKRNHQAVLFKSLNIDEDAEILKNYLIGIQRKNGKYALAIFWKKPQQLLFDIDDLIEANLEDMLSSNPEVLVPSVNALLGRIKYCQENGQPLYEKDESSFNKNVIDFYKFHEKYNTDAVEYIPRQREDVNGSLSRIIGNSDFVDLLIQTLDEYYKKTTTFKNIDLTLEEQQTCKDLIKMFEEDMKATSVGTHTYQIADVSISKNKLERNLSLLIESLMSHKEPVIGVEKEILLVSALYNLRQSEENLQHVVDSCLNFNNSATYGGKEL